jgi:hypothetical protein
MHPVTLLIYSIFINMNLKCCGIPVYVLCTLPCMLVSLKNHAAIISTPIHFSDTSGPLTKPSHLNRTEFMCKYGKDDTSRALIAFFFRKRSVGKKFILYPLVLVFAGAIGLTIYLTYYVVPAGFGWPFIFLSVQLIALTFIFSIIGAMVLIKHSRKKLLSLLNKYNEGRSIPDQIKKNSFFKSQLLVNK